MMTKEECTKIVNFMTLWTGILVLGHGHTSLILEMLSFLSHSGDLFSWVGFHCSESFVVC